MSGGRLPRSTTPTRSTGRKFSSPLSPWLPPTDCGRVSKPWLPPTATRRHCRSRAGSTRRTPRYRRRRRSRRSHRSGSRPSRPRTRGRGGRRRPSVPQRQLDAAVPVAGRVGAELPLEPVRQHGRGGGGAVVGGRAVAPDMTALITLGLPTSTIIRVLRDRLTIHAAVAWFRGKAANMRLPCARRPPGRRGDCHPTDDPSHSDHSANPHAQRSPAGRASSTDLVRPGGRRHGYAAGRAWKFKLKSAIRAAYDNSRSATRHRDATPIEDEPPASPPRQKWPRTPSAAAWAPHERNHTNSAPGGRPRAGPSAAPAAAPNPPAADRARRAPTRRSAKKRAAPIPGKLFEVWFPITPTSCAGTTRAAGAASLRTRTGSRRSSCRAFLRSRRALGWSSRSRDN